MGISNIVVKGYGVLSDCSPITENAKRSRRSKVSISEPEELRSLRLAIDGGTPFRQAMFEAIGMWKRVEERWRGRTYRYLLHGEAFDWLLLAERLCAGLGGSVPVLLKEEILFNGYKLDESSQMELKKFVSLNKHRCILNFWYGVVVEEALQMAVEDEVRKGQRAAGRPDDDDLIEVAYERLYNDTRRSLLGSFRSEMGYPSTEHLSITEYKEFTYWLYKLRIRFWDPARVASDIKKGLDKLLEIQGNSV